MFLNLIYKGADSVVKVWDVNKQKDIYSLDRLHNVFLFFKNFLILLFIGIYSILSVECGWQFACNTM
jgi:hypothetical protein